MANSGAIIQTTSRASGGIFSKLFKIKWSYVFLIFLFVQTIAVAIHNGEGVSGVVFELGKTFFGIVSEIQNISNDIIQSNASFKGFFDLISTIWLLVASIWKIYLWFQLLNWGWSRYNDSQKLFTYFLSTITFVVIEIFYLFFLSSTGSDLVYGYSFFDILKSPYNALVSLLHAIILLFSSFDISKPVSSIINNTNSSNINVCSDLSGCVI